MRFPWLSLPFLVSCLRRLPCPYPPPYWRQESNRTQHPNRGRGQSPLLEGKPEQPDFHNPSRDLLHRELRLAHRRSSLYRGRFQVVHHYLRNMSLTTRSNNCSPVRLCTMPYSLCKIKFTPIFFATTSKPPRLIEAAAAVRCSIHAETSPAPDSAIICGLQALCDQLI